MVDNITKQKQHPVNNTLDEPLKTSPVVEETKTFDQPIPPQPTEPSKLAKPKKPLMVISTFLFVILLTGLGYYFYQNMQLKNKLTQPTPSSNTTPSPTPDPTTDWQTYTLGKYQFKLPGQFSPKTNSSDILSAKSGENPELQFTLDLGAGTGYECIEKIETHTLIGLNKTITQDIYQGLPAGACIMDNTDNSDYYVLMARLSEPEVEPFDTLILTFHTPTYTLNQAKTLFSQILSTFEFLD